MYQLLEEEQPRILETMITVDGCDSSDASITELACSFVHRIATRPKLIPYTNMVKWILDNTDISNREFKTIGQEAIRSFTPDNLRLMYHLLEPQVTYNRQFVDKFVKENEDRMDCTKNWSNNDERIKKDNKSMYSTTSICSPFCFVAFMLCRLFGKPDSNKFSSKWLPLIDAVINATIID